MRGDMGEPDEFILTSDSSSEFEALDAVYADLSPSRAAPQRHDSSAMEGVELHDGDSPEVEY